MGPHSGLNQSSRWLYILKCGNHGFRVPGVGLDPCCQGLLTLALQRVSPSLALPPHRSLLLPHTPPHCPVFPPSLSTVSPDPEDRLRNTPARSASSQNPHSASVTATSSRRTVPMARLQGPPSPVAQRAGEGGGVCALPSSPILLPDGSGSPCNRNRGDVLNKEMLTTEKLHT